MRSSRIILMIVGLFSIAVGVVGYTGSFRRAMADPNQALFEETYNIIDAAQLWYARPQTRGGGGRSFLGLDFGVLKLEKTAGAIVHDGRHGHYHIMNLTPDNFDLMVEGVAAKPKFEVKGIAFDSRVDLKALIKGR